MPSAVQHKVQGEHFTCVEHETQNSPRVNVARNHMSVCLGVEGVWSCLFASKAWRVFLTLAKASSHKISLLAPEATARTWEGTEFAAAL